MNEQQCAYCTPARMGRAHDAGFTVVTECPHCRGLYADALSVVLLDRDSARCQRLTALLRANGIRVTSANRIADLERWPVEDVLITDRANASPSWKAVGVTHIIVLVQSAEDRLAAQRMGAVATVQDHNPAALLSILRGLVQARLTHPLARTE